MKQDWNRSKPSAF